MDSRQKCGWKRRLQRSRSLDYISMARWVSLISTLRGIVLISKQSLKISRYYTSRTSLSSNTTMWEEPKTTWISTTRSLTTRHTFQAHSSGTLSSSHEMTEARWVYAPTWQTCFASSRPMHACRSSKTCKHLVRLSRLAPTSDNSARIIRKAKAKLCQI